jgi:2,4-dienoyl-CoA reductase-like NADH-dependent reductase (Old Yellow Enzyme family)
MNNRLKELFDLCWFDNDTENYGKDFSIDDSMGYSFDAEKFAELIVEECLDLVSYGGEFCSRPKLVEKIKEHFGVEE